MKRLLLVIFFAVNFSSAVMFAQELQKRFPSLNLIQYERAFFMDLEQKVTAFSVKNIKNNLVQLARSKSNAKSIRKINLNKNGLQILPLPNFFDNFCYLEYLDLSKNSLSKIPSLKNLTCLVHLDVSENKLEDISFLEGNNFVIKFLALSGNPLLKDGFKIAEEKFVNLEALLLIDHKFSEKEQKRIKQELQRNYGNRLQVLFKERNLKEGFISESTLECTSEDDIKKDFEEDEDAQFEKEFVRI